jgi:PPK2 family polyphosphate:nucleotide phosphotransferase
MFDAVLSPYLVPFDGSFRVSKASNRPPDAAPSKKDAQKALSEAVAGISELQRVLYAADRHSVLLIFQAMDAAGKDGTIAAVTSGINPAGFQVYSFKQPSAEELDHDFLWRTTSRLPERGRIGVFNRSYYEEVLAVRVHPLFLDAQRLPWRPKDLDDLWQERYESIREHEHHLARNGTVILKFWLNVSKSEQRERFLARIDTPEKNWKFSVSDLAERQHWEAYMDAYEGALNGTSRPWAPWYAIPADSKSYMRLTIARIIAESLNRLCLAYPAVSKKTREELDEMRRMLSHE